METIKKLVWSEKLTMFNAKLDTQHQTLYNYINDIISLEELYPKSEKFAEMLSRISDYGLEHFKEEERLMLDYGYPDYHLHKHEHKNYLFEVAMFNVNFNQPKHTEPLVVIEFLKSWWYKHIMRCDMRFSRFILKQLSA
jgi:hemerythrin